MEFRHPLVYTDGRPEGVRALEVAAAMVRRNGGRLTVLHVAEPPLPIHELEAELGEALRSGQLDELDRMRDRARELGVEVACEMRVGRPFVEIIRLAESAGCDLVVKAARGRKRLGWPLLGSTALHLVRKCPVPVWLVGEQPQAVPRRVMALLSSDPVSDERIALDRRVLSVAEALAVETDAELRVGAAWEVPGDALLRKRMSDEAFDAYVAGARRQAEDGLGSALEPFRDRIHPARVHLVRGVPYIELVDLAAREADLVVIGTTPPSAGAAFLIREEAEEVIHRFDGSIVALKPEGFVSPVATETSSSPEASPLP